MALTSEQQNAIERLHENESLTDNLTDGDARALLDWAQNQIIANADSKLVQSAVSAANASGLAGVQPLLAQATSFLTQQLAARSATLAPPATAPAPLPPSSDAAPALEAAPAPAAPPVPSIPEINITATDTAPMPSHLEASGQAGEAPTLSAHADAAASPTTSPSAPPSPTPAPKQKSPRKSRRKKKTS